MRSEETPAVFAFGPYRLEPARRLLTRGRETVPVGSRALEILTALLERSGQLVTREELFARAWPNLAVEESNLRAQIAGLRKALDEERLGEHFIHAVPGRGYRFVEPVRTKFFDSVNSDLTTRAPLPVRLSPVIGRAEVLQAVAARALRRRLVTIVGPGGIGKTTVAVAAAKRMAADFPDGVCFVDLTPLADPSLLPATLAGALGLSTGGHDRVSEWAPQLRTMRVLLVLDNCERVAAAAAEVCEEILKLAPEAHILATSREPLLAEAESVYRLAPLETPEALAGLTAQQAMDFSSVQLFVERASSRGYEPAERDAPLIADICRQLDGVALAIELAASRVDAFGLRGVAERLDDRIRLLTGGRRTALPRHRTLSATLDWSYDTLSQEEQIVFRRLAVFAGGFSLEAAADVTRDDDRRAYDSDDLISRLVMKSLVVADINREPVRYRLLETTRAYGLAKLSEHNETAPVAFRHAQYFCARFDAAFADARGELGVETLSGHALEIANVRAALTWCYAGERNIDLGASLTVAAIPLWFQLSATDECREAVQRALKKTLKPKTRSTYSRKIMQMYVTLGLSRAFTIGLAPQALEAWRKALEIAEALGDLHYQLEALWGLWLCEMGDGLYRRALEIAETFLSRAGARADLCLAQQMRALPLHALGQHAEAWRLIERSMRDAEDEKAAPGFRFSQPMYPRAILAQLLWLQGFPDRAMAMANESLALARTTGHALSAADALAQALCPVAIFARDEDEAAQAVDALLALSETPGLASWGVLGRCWSAALQIRRGDVARGVASLAETLGTLRKVKFALYRTLLMGILAEGYAALEQLSDAAALIQDAIDRAQRQEDNWCLPELLRIRAAILSKQGLLADAEGSFVQAINLAKHHGATGWEMRAATELAQLRPR